MYTTSENFEIKIKKISSKLFNREYVQTIGRASYSIFSILNVIKKANNNIIAIPSIVCHRLLSAVLEAGWKPYFCDIDPRTGNVPLSQFKKAYGHGVRCFLHVQLYGNSNHIDKLCETFKKKDVFIIEDACQSYGGKINKKPLGSFGNISLTSFGYSKLIDVGFNALFMSNDNHLINELNFFLKKHEKNIIENHIGNFKNIFYEKKQLFKKDLKNCHFKNILKDYKYNLFKKWNRTYEEKIYQDLKNINELIDDRIGKFLLYKKYINKDRFQLVDIPKESVPWRANYLIHNSNFSKQFFLSEKLRNNQIHVSNWYFPCHWFLNAETTKSKSLKNSFLFSSRVIQFWIDKKINKKKIFNDIKIINNYK